EDRTREAGRGDHVVDLEDQLGGALGLARVHAEDVAASLYALDRRIEDDDAACEDMVLVRLHVPRADADERARVDRELRRRWRREDDLLGPLQETGGELEAGVLLADDEDAAPGIRFGRPRLGVVRRVLDPGHLRTPRLGDPDREERDLTPIVAVARFEHPALPVPSRPGPPASVAHLELRPLRERGEIPLHLRARGVVRGAIHHRAHEGAALLLFGEQAVPVVAFVLAGALLEGRVRLGPRKKALEDR